ncbi:hypothetical protein BDR07DRAFT_1495396 [Suillus spraguei]|nr:hypothetical protein BDR07DRAFT_1495396 [Suillus spraguei]
MAKAFKSTEFVDDTDTDVMELSSSLSKSDSDESSGSTAIAEQALLARDSIDHELDAMDRLPPEASVPAIAIPPTQQQQKKGQMNAYISEPFDIFKAQVLQKIDEQTKPDKISYDNYTALYAIPQILPTPMSLSVTNWGGVTSDSEKTQSVCWEFLQCPEEDKCKGHPSDKENDGDIDSTGSSTDNDSDEPRKKRKKKNDKKKKTQAPKASDIDDSDKSLNKNIRDLRNQWVCHKKPGCPSEHCYINAADGRSHVALSFPLLECWGSAMLKGAEYATIEMPPNHAHFSIIPTELLGRPSLLSIRHQQLDEQTKAKAVTAPSPLTPSQPVINVNFPPEMFQPLQAMDPVPTHIPAASQLPGVHATTASLLLPTQLATPGPRMSLADFCVAFDVSDALQTKLSNNRFTSSHSLHFASLDDLKTIGILCGKLTQLKDAIQLPRMTCEFTPWFDYIAGVLIELSDAEECASREADTIKDFTKTKDILLIQANGSEFDVR